MLNAIKMNFLGRSPDWYKATIVAFLIINPVVFFFVSPFAAGWLLVAEFIFTLAMALKCYPLQSGGLLVVQALMIGMTSPESVKHELVANIEVLLLLIFMVAGIHFMKDLLLAVFTKMLLRVQSKVLLSVSFCVVSALLSGFLDALTVIAAVISVAIGFYNIYQKAASSDTGLDLTKNDLEQYRSFLRSLMMYAGIGTALGGVMTMVGEPQNLIIAERMGWGFAEFFMRMTPVTIPVFIAGIVVVVIVEKFKLFGYGAALPEKVRRVLVENDLAQTKKQTKQDQAKLVVQIIIALWLIVALAFHLAAVGLIGLSVIILATSFTGITDEHTIGKAFEEALPFTALLAVFFSVVSVIIDQQLFRPIIDAVLAFEGKTQVVMFYLANGLLSMISDNVFVGTVYINEVRAAYLEGVISRAQFENLAVAINTGTNLPSVATPNGQAAFLFLLTSALAPLIQLSYGRMVVMALPFTITLTTVGLICIAFFSGF